MRKILSLILVLTLLLGTLSSCVFENPATEVVISGGDIINIDVGSSYQLTVEYDGYLGGALRWESSNEALVVTESGKVSANTPCTAIITVICGDLTDTIIIVVEGDTPDTPDEIPDETPDETPDKKPEPIVTTDGEEIYVDPDKYENMTAAEFYANYTPAVSYLDAQLRSAESFMSGSIVVPDEAPTIAEYRPMVDGKYVKNTASYYSPSGNTYTVIDGYGNVVMRIYRGGGYITLEEVAAYIWAFGEIPANYDTNKNNKTVSRSPKSAWGEYLRLNHSSFSGDTSRYPYEPKLPNISGCGGNLNYMELDIGTTGTSSGDGYQVSTYNNGTKINRGAARIVYGRRDLNRNGIFEHNELHIFYTYNHYNDFREYLNYYGGWGEMFGNITGGGTLSSKYDYNPTPYVDVHYESVRDLAIVAVTVVSPAWLSKSEMYCA